MSRWLVCLATCCGLWVAVTASSAPGQRHRSETGAAKSTAAKKVSRSSPRRDVQAAGELQPDACQQVERPEAPDKSQRSEAARKDQRHRGGGRHGPSQAHIHRFIYDAVRRTGGPLELLPLLHIRQVREKMQVDEEAFKPKLDAYMAEMFKRGDENRKLIASQPKSSFGELFNDHLEQENEHFQKFLDQLTEAQRDQLIFLFVQARNYRSLSNRLVQDKMGMSEEQQKNIRQEIEDIREQTIDETRDRFRRIFDKGGGRDEFEKMVRENQHKMDARIEKKLTDAEREKFAELRTKTAAEPPEWLIRGLEFPFGPNPSPRQTPRGQPTTKESSSRK